MLISIKELDGFYDAISFNFLIKHEINNKTFEIIFLQINLIVRIPNNQLLHFLFEVLAVGRADQYCRWKLCFKVDNLKANLSILWIFGRKLNVLSWKEFVLTFKRIKHRNCELQFMHPWFSHETIKLNYSRLGVKLPSVTHFWNIISRGLTGATWSGLPSYWIGKFKSNI